MRRVRVRRGCDEAHLTAPVLEDFSRFKEKVIMISTLKHLVEESDRKQLKSIIRQLDLSIGAGDLRRALEAIVKHEIKRVRS
jgi:hypothetical protein